MMYLLFYTPETPDSVAIGGVETVRLPCAEYYYIKVSSKPSAMVLRLLEKLFSKETPSLYGPAHISPNLGCID